MLSTSSIKCNRRARILVATGVSVIAALIAFTSTTTSTLAFVIPSSSSSSSNSRSSRTSTSNSMKLYFNSNSNNNNNFSPSFSSPNSDSEKFRAAIAAAAAAKSMYYQSELTIQELNQIRAQFELLLHKSGKAHGTNGNHHHQQHHHTSSFDSSTQRPGLEVYYPEGVIHNPTPPTQSTTSTSDNDGSYQLLQPQEAYDGRTNDENLWCTDIIYDEDSNLRLLTMAGRRLRELEIQLLESLRTNNDGIDQLIHLWTTERNAESAYALLQMQNSNQICSVGLVKEEADLAELCRNYPGWAEPWSRLATLLFYKGIARWSDALSAAEEAIRIKPWHFEALNVCTLILSQMDHPDNPSVIFGDDETVDDLRRRCYRLSRLSLPKIDHASRESDIEARNIWVSRAVATAQYQLQCAEQYTAAARNRPILNNDLSYQNHNQPTQPPQHYSQSYNHQHSSNNGGSLFSNNNSNEHHHHHHHQNIVTDAWQ